jgi:hypothetical protein
VSLSTEGFTRIGTLTVPALGAGVTATNVPLVIRPQLEFTTLMLSKINATGGDLRLSSDAAGNSELSKELVKFDKTTGDIVWSNFPSAVEGLVYHVWAEKPAATQPAVGGAFGRNAVWVDEGVRYHFKGAVGTGDPDATGNQPDLIANGTVLQHPDGWDMPNSIASRADNAFTATIPASYTIYSKQLISSITNYGPGLGLAAFPDFWGESGAYHGAGNGVVYAGLSVANRLNTATGVMGVSTAFQILATTFDGTNITLYKDGALKAQVAQTQTPTNISGFWVGNRQSGGPSSVVFSDSGYSKYAKSANHLKIEADNQLATTAWWIAADVGGATSNTVIKTINITASFLQSVESTSNIAFSLNQKVTSQKTIETAMLQKATADTNITTGFKSRTAKTSTITTGFRARIVKASSITTGFRARIAKASDITTSFQSRTSKTVNVTTSFKSRIAKVLNITFDLLESGVAATVSRTINITTSLLQRVDTAFNISSSLKQRVTKTLSISTALNVRVNGELLTQTAFKETVSAFKNITTSFLQQTTEIKNITFSIDGLQPLLAPGATFRLSVIDTTFRLSVIEPSYKFTIKG